MTTIGMCGIPASEFLKEHQKIHLPRTYLIGPAPERHRTTVFSAVELREKLRSERTNLVPKVIETWQEVPLELQIMDGSDPLYAYIGIHDSTLHPFVRPGAFVRIDSRQKKIPALRWRSDFDRPISLSNCANVMSAPGAKCMMAELFSFLRSNQIAARCACTIPRMQPLSAVSPESR
jgi:hypothetical protein